MNRPRSATTSRILCIGNKYIESDALGARVHAILAQRDLPADIELVDGGLAGLNLLRFFDDCARVVIVDAMDTPDPNNIFIMDEADIACAGYGHSAGLGYLLRARALLAEHEDPSKQNARVVIVAGGNLAVEQAAELSLKIAREGRLPPDGEIPA